MSIEQPRGFPLLNCSLNTFRYDDGRWHAVAVCDVAHLEADAVTRLEDDHGDHDLAVVITLRPRGKIAIWFDWYGNASEIQSLHDGYRGYTREPRASAPDEIRYRIQGFRGCPPRVNLRAFIDDALVDALAREAIGMFDAASTRGATAAPPDAAEAEKRFRSLSGISIGFPQDDVDFVPVEVRRESFAGRPAASLRFSYAGAGYLLVVSARDRLPGAPSFAAFPEGSFVSGERDGRSFVPSRGSR